MDEAPRGPEEPNHPIPPGDVGALALLAITTVALFFEGIVLGNVPAVRDQLGWAVPTRFLWRESILSGHLPAWDPYAALGIPVFAATVRGAVYPGHLLLLLGSFATAYTLTYVVHAALPSLGAYLLARRVGCRPATALLSALVWLAGGYAISMWYNGDKVLSGAFIPWVAVAAREAAVSTRRRNGWVALTAVFLALILLAGDVFFAGYSLVLALPVVLSARSDEPLHAAAQRGVVQLGGACALALLLASPSLVPASALRGATERAVPYPVSIAESWSLHPVRALELLSPTALGDPRDLERYPGGFYADDPTIQAHPWAVSVYCGVAVLLFAVAAGRGRLQRGLVVAALLSLLAALGRHTPFHTLLRFVIIPLRYMRYPEKHVVVALGALALLSALGAERLLQRKARLTATCVAAGAIAPLALLASPALLRATVGHGLLHTLPFAALALGAVLVARRLPRAEALLPCVVALDLVLATRPLLAWVPPSALTDSPFGQALTRPLGPTPHRILRPRVASDFDVLQLPDGAAALYGVQAFPGAEPARPPVHEKLLATLKVDPAKTVRLLRADAMLLEDDMTQGRGKPIARYGGMTLYPVPLLPRAWMVTRAVEVPDEGVVDAVFAPAFDPELEAAIPPGFTPAGLDASPEARGNAGACVVTAYAAEAMDVICEPHRRALAVVAEQWADGWSVTVDGAAAPIARVDGLLRGVALDPGHHELRFRYRVPGLRAGFALGALGVLLTLSLALEARWRRRQPAARRASGTDSSSESTS